jgi:hypothetical protein
MKARKSYLLRLSPELYDALEGWAQQELRSVNGQIEYLLKEAVQRRRRLPEEPPEPPPPDQAAKGAAARRPSAGSG